MFYRNLYGSTHFCGSHFLSLLYSLFYRKSNKIQNLYYNFNEYLSIPFILLNKMHFVKIERIFIGFLLVIIPILYNFSQKKSTIFDWFLYLCSKKFEHICYMEQVVGIEPTSSAWKAEVLPLNYTCDYEIVISFPHIINKCGAGSGNRTHVISLEGWGSTIELHLHFSWQL